MQIWRDEDQGQRGTNNSIVWHKMDYQRVRCDMNKYNYIWRNVEGVRLYDRLHQFNLDSFVQFKIHFEVKFDYFGLRVV